MSKNLLSEYFKGDELEIIGKPYKVESNNGRLLKIKCKICNVIKNVYLSAIRNGKSVKHGQSCVMSLNDGTVYFKDFYNVWRGVKIRTTNVNHIHADRYVNRGIKNDFKHFTEFYNTLYNSYKDHRDNNDSTTLDRIENDSNYSPSNCRWVTHKENCNNIENRKNQRKFQAISPKGEIYEYNNQHKCGRIHELNYKNINKCLKGKALTHKKWKFKYID